MAWCKAEKIVLAGLIGSGSVLHLSLPSSVPNIHFAQLLEFVNKQKNWSITVVNMQYARVSTEDGGKLMPSATYHVMLGRSPADTVRYTQLLSEKLCDEGFELKLEESSVFDEAYANSTAILRNLHVYSSQFIAQKYATVG
jgi:hypothetical protein